MFLDLFVLAFLATSPALTAVVTENSYSCSLDEFACDNGACVSLDYQCDGQQQCADGSDEALCFSSSNSIPFGDPVISRSKRQTSCRKNQFQCRDGSCISFDGKCDGMVDCADGSDETHPLCRKMECQSNWFRCTYGACVDGTAPCNGIQECADNSDELLPRCRNETDEIKGRFKCQDGTTISAASHCDGTVDCPDGSDETVRACAANSCPSYLFQCAYGACVDQGSDCNNKVECADGSDESDELCNRLSPGPATAAPTSPPQTGNCILPPYPNHGRYVVGGVPNASPGQRFNAVQINVTCDRDYGVVGKSSLYCFGGAWSDNFPECSRFCRLPKHPSVTYRCVISGPSVSGTRDCEEYEPGGTVVRPECNSPNYYSEGVIFSMRCYDGSWDNVVTCRPECGTVTPEGEQLVVGGRQAKRGELPWHTGIYRKTTTPYMQICGGTLVSSTVVISAAHCFWTDLDHLLSADMFAIAVGKLYRPYNDPVDVDAQKSDVSDIHIPPRFRGSAGNFQDDIATLLLKVTITFKTYVRPVCLNFDFAFNNRQLQEGNMGKVAGWGLTAADGKASPILRVVDLPSVDVTKCIDLSPPGFTAYITSDKICAGYTNGTALCKGDSGGGLVFPSTDRGIKRYYLRGIVSTAPNNEDLCNANAITSFTQIQSHENFIKEYLHN